MKNVTKELNKPSTLKKSKKYIFTRRKLINKYILFDPTFYEDKGNSAVHSAVLSAVLSTG